MSPKKFKRKISGIAEKERQLYMLNINFWNIAFTIINILVLYLFLKHFLMKPVMAILEERKQMVEKELDEAAVSSRDADLLKKKL